MVRPPAGSDAGALRSCRRAISSRAFSDDRHRPHRLDRHGQDRDRAHVRRARRSCFRFRCDRASRSTTRGVQPWHRLPRPFLASSPKAVSTALKLAASSCRPSRRTSPGSRLSFIHWCAPSRKPFSRRRARQGAPRRARYPATVRDRPRRRCRQDRRRLGAGRCPAGSRPGPPGNDRGEIRRHPRPPAMPMRKNASRADFIVDSSRGLDHARATGARI